MSDTITKKKKIGQILLGHNFITKAMLDEALNYQSKFGGSITQYLLRAEYLKEEDLTKCLCDQFGIPLLPLKNYNIAEEIINLIPLNIVERYWLIPVDRLEDILTVVMFDPTEVKAIEEVEKITGYKVQPFVGIFTDILEAIKHYYKIAVIDEKLKVKKPIPFFVETKNYKGIDRRGFVRIKAKIDIHFPLQDAYRKTKTKNVSAGGLLFESGKALPLNSYVTLQIDLPKKFYAFPIAAIVEVVRIQPLANNKFDIGAKWVKIAKEDLQIIIKYAHTSKDDNA